MSNPDETSGVFDIIDTEEHVAPTPAETKPETKTETKTQTQTKSEEEVTPDDERGTDTQDFSRETETPAEDRDSRQPPNLHKQKQKLRQSQLTTTGS
jgi:hypothetical protein